MKALIIEDNRIDAMVLKRAIAPYGVCDIADNGKEALEEFRKALEGEETYDLICLDILMPEMDGHGVLSEIRKIEEKKGIPNTEAVKVIMVSAASFEDNIAKAFKGKCDAYLEKPIDKTALLQYLYDFGWIDFDSFMNNTKK